MDIQLSVTGDSGTRQITVDHYPYRIGRDPGNDLILEGPSHELVSGFHAEIQLDKGSALLCDLDSTNGSWVDGRRVTGSVRLKNGAVIELGARDSTKIVAALGAGTEATRIATQPTRIATAGAEALELYYLSGSLRGETDRLGGASILLGRDPSCDVVFNSSVDGEVSTRHAEISRRGTQYWVKDLGSTNGTYVNGSRITEQELRTGDVLEFGKGGPRARVGLPASAGVAKTQISSRGEAPRGATRVADRPAAGLDPGSGPSPGQGTIQMWIDRAVEQARKNPATVFFERVAEEAAGRTKKTARLYSATVFGVLLIAIVGVAVYNNFQIGELEQLLTTQIAGVRGDLELQEGVLQNNIDQLQAKLDDVAGGLVDTTMFKDALEAERSRLQAVRSQIQKLNEQAQAPTKEGAAAVAGFQAAAQSVEASLFMLAIRQSGRLLPICTSFAVRPDGILLTNAHCVVSSSTRQAFPPGDLVVVKSGSRRGKEYNVFAVEVHPAYSPATGAFDLALLRLETHGDSFVPMPMAPAEELESIGPGYQIAVYGFPGELMNLDRPNATYLPGAVTQLSSGGTVLMHSCATSRGTSGAPVLNDKGQIVGVNSFGTRSNDRAEVVIARDAGGAVILGPDGQPLVREVRQATVEAANGAVHGRFVREWLAGSQIGVEAGGE